MSAGAGKAAETNKPELPAQIEDPLALQMHLKNPEAFKKLDFWDQMDAMVAHMCVPNPEMFMFFVVSLFTWAFQCGVIYLLLRFGQVLGPDGPEFRFEWGDASFQQVFFKTTIAWASTASFLCLDGMYVSLFTGYAASTRTWQVGSMKEPFWGLTRVLGSRRNVLDGPVLSGAFVASRLWVALSPAPSAPAATAYFLTTLFLLICNYSQYIGASGFYHGPLSVYILLKYTATPGSLAWLQVMLVLLYVGCGIGKLGPWFIQVFSQEWTMPPWAKCLDLKRLFYKRGVPRDNTHSTFAAFFAYAAALSEAAMGLLFFLPMSVVSGTSLASSPLDGCSLPVFLALALIAVMHLYVVLHMPVGDVWTLNFLAMYMAYYAFYVAPPAEAGFDYASFAALPRAMRCACVGFASFVIFGQCNTDKVTYTNAYRFWAGNWPQAYWFLTKSAMEKVEREFPREWAQMKPGHVPILKGHPQQAWMVEATDYMLFGQSQTAQLCHRVMPKLVHKVTKGKSLTDCAKEGCYFTMAFFLNQWCLGPTGNCTLRCFHVIKAMQERCAFERGECTLINVYSFQLYQAFSGKSKTAWQIVDAKDGIIEEGTISIDECLAITRPSIWKDNPLGNASASASLRQPLLE